MPVMNIATTEIVKIIAHEVLRVAQNNNWPSILSIEYVSLNVHGKELV